MTNQEKPLVGLAAIVIKEDKVLLGKRKGSHGAGTWAFPGDKIRFGETHIECCLREVKEKTNLDVELPSERLYALTTDIFPEGLHYVTIFMRAKYTCGIPKVMEPDKCDGWHWFSWDSLPAPLFLPVKNLVQRGYNPLSPDEDKLDAIFSK